MKSFFENVYRWFVVFSVYAVSVLFVSVTMTLVIFLTVTFLKAGGVRW